MKKTTRRVKTRTSAGPSKKSANKKTARNRSGAYRGASGFERGEERRQRQEEEYQKRINTPFSFRLKPGDEAEVVVLDSTEPFFLSMHKLKDPKGRWVDEVCIADTGERCPLCESTGKEGSFTMWLTVLDRRSYKNREGKTIKASKKLLLVKGRNLPKFKRQWEKYEGKKTSWRGLRINCHRDGEKEAAIGEDLEFLGLVPEAKLGKFKDIAKPVDYEEIFPLPSAKELVKRYNLGKTKVAGSQDFADDDDDYDMDDVGW